MKIPDFIARWFQTKTFRSMNDVLRELAMEQASATGVSVTPKSAMQCSAVYACVRVLAESVASLPLMVYRKGANGNRERAEDLPIYSLLHDSPNPYQTSYEFRECLMYHLCLRGNAYAQIIRVGGWPRELWMIHPDNVKIEQLPDKSLRYEVRVEGKQWEEIPQSEIMHIRGISSDGIVGISPLTAAREAVGLALATEKYGAKVFSSFGRPSGILTTDGILSPEAKNQLKIDWQTAYAGLENAHSTAVLPPGVKWQAMSISAEDAQFLQTRAFQIEEIARIYRVPAVLLQHSDKTASYASSEQFFLSFLTYTLQPWLVRWEQALKRDLIPTREQKNLYCEFSMQGLMRSTADVRGRFYMIMLQNGVLNPNEVRGFENLSPRDGGDEYFTPLNMVTEANLSGDGTGATPRRETEASND